MRSRGVGQARGRADWSDGAAGGGSVAHDPPCRLARPVEIGLVARETPQGGVGVHDGGGDGLPDFVRAERRELHREIAHVGPQPQRKPTA
jgi:hypothetical protein